MKMKMKILPQFKEFQRATRKQPTWNLIFAENNANEKSLENV